MDFAVASLGASKPSPFSGEAQEGHFLAWTEPLHGCPPPTNTPVPETGSTEVLHAHTQRETGPCPPPQSCPTKKWHTPFPPPLQRPAGGRLLLRWAWAREALRPPPALRIPGPAGLAAALGNWVSPTL